MDPLTIIAVGTAALQGIQAALDAWPLISKLVSGGDVTADEQKTIDAGVDAAHAELQAATASTAS